METEFVTVEMKIEKIFDGTAMEYKVIDSSEKLSEKFKEVLRKEYDVDVEIYSALMVDEQMVDLE